jgi:hypothetical protein
VDAQSRFFLDSWLKDVSSSVKKADTLSIELLCVLQKAQSDAATQVRDVETFSSLHTRE